MATYNWNKQKRNREKNVWEGWVRRGGNTKVSLKGGNRIGQQARKRGRASLTRYTGTG